MSKLWNYFGLLSITIIVFNLLGILNGGVFSAMYTMITNPSGMNQTYFYLTLVSIISAGIVTTYVGSYRADMAVIGPFLLLLIPMGWDVLQIVILLTSVHPALGVIIGGPTMFLYIITIVEWWRGTDN